MTVCRPPKRRLRRLLSSYRRHCIAIGVLLLLASIFTISLAFSSPFYFNYHNPTANNQQSRVDDALYYEQLELSTTTTAVKSSSERQLTWKDESTSGKLVVLFTSFFGDTAWSDLVRANLGPRIELPASTGTCFLSTDKSLLDKAAAVVFHGRDIDDPVLVGDRTNRTETDVQQLVRQHGLRASSQHWVFYLLESPINSKLNELAARSDPWLQQLPVFNWTMTYHSQRANIFTPLIEFNQLAANISSSKTSLPLSPPTAGRRAHQEKTASASGVNNRTHLIRGFVESFQSRRYDALWVVSNCGPTHSRREHLVDHLRLLYGISVNIIGQCSHSSLSWQKIYRPEFAAQHRFYFAFENSLCEDYMTEKAWHAYNMSYHFGLIPVVLGAGSGSYARLLPAGSYVDVESFDEPSFFASFLHRLSRSKPDELQSFFQWQYALALDTRDHSVRGFERLWHQQPPSPPPTGLAFRHVMGSCHQSNWFAALGLLRWNL